MKKIRGRKSLDTVPLSTGINNNNLNLFENGDFTVSTLSQDLDLEL
jgi:hypothetical protein